MSQKRKLVFLDIDGTILPYGKEMTPRVKRALLQAKENGHCLCICSGRAYSEIPERMKGFDGVISAAGACIMWKGKILLAEYFSAQETEDVARLLEEANAIYIMEGLEHLYMKKDMRERIMGTLKQSDEKERRTLSYFGDTLPCASLREMTKVHKCSYFYAEKAGDWFRERLAPWNMNVSAFSQAETRGNSGEITKTPFHKGAAVRYLSEYLDIPIEDTIAIGDSENDLEMLKAAGVGIAMGNSYDHVKEAADDITKSVYEDGVYHAFRKYGLIS